MAMTSDYGTGRRTFGLVAMLCALNGAAIALAVGAPRVHVVIVLIVLIGFVIAVAGVVQRGHDTAGTGQAVYTDLACSEPPKIGQVWHSPWASVTPWVTIYDQGVLDWFIENGYALKGWDLVGTVTPVGTHPPVTMRCAFVACGREFNPVTEPGGLLFSPPTRQSQRPTTVFKYHLCEPCTRRLVYTDLACSEPPLPPALDIAFDDDFDDT